MVDISFMNYLNDLLMEIWRIIIIDEEDYFLNKSNFFISILDW
jgi:hypothetical protein